MKSCNLVASVYFLADILPKPKLTALSLVFQKHVDLTVIQPQVNVTIASLKLLLSHPGPYMQSLDEILTQLSHSFSFAFTDRQKVSSYRISN